MIFQGDSSKLLPLNYVEHTQYGVLPVVDETDQTFVVENLERVLSKLLKGDLVCSKQCFTCNLQPAHHQTS